MLSKKPAILISTSNAFSTLTCGTSQSQPGFCSITKTYPRTSHRRRRRSYATIQDNTGDSPLWPDQSQLRRPPTPYEIFNQKRGEPYSKRRFYELVKLYHPDRNNIPDEPLSSTSACSPAVMLERYRLVIAANAILSDPEKRDAYDRFGHGWTQHDTSTGTPGAYKYGECYRRHKTTAEAYQWAPYQDPMFNATWEDWERWYQEQYANQYQHHDKSSRRWSSNFFTGRGSSQTPVFTNNYAFISLVFLLAALGGMGQATRANEYAKSRWERSQTISEESGRHLHDVRQGTRDRFGEGETKEQRIRRFISDKEAYDNGEFDGRALREGDENFCAPGLVKDRDQPRFWQRPPER